MTFNDTNDDSFSVYIGCTHAGIPAFISSEIILWAITDYIEIYIITIYYFSTKNNQRPLLSNVKYEYSKLSNIQKINY